MSGKKNLGKALKEYMAPKPSQEDARKHLSRLDSRGFNLQPFVSVRRTAARFQMATIRQSSPIPAHGSNRPIFSAQLRTATVRQSSPILECYRKFKPGTVELLAKQWRVVTNGKQVAENGHRLTHKQRFNHKCYGYDEIHLCGCSS
ncbi:hypothetical protein Csa_008179 [Cucumis sativus]|nr:hypothetical protein Csa_008179 [Cucumis sativus]